VTKGLDELVAQGTEHLRRHGRDPAVVENLRRHPVLHEVVGKWPPDTPPKATATDIHAAMGAVEAAIGGLRSAGPSDPVSDDLQTILRRLHTTAQIVGPWPPK
jgi:hypothetical protein